MKGNAFVYGDITCQSITVEPSARIVGRVNIHSAAPRTLDADGNIINDKVSEVCGLQFKVDDRSQYSHVLQAGPAEDTSGKKKGEFQFDGAAAKDSAVDVVVSNKSLVPHDNVDKVAEETRRHEEEAKLKHLAEQKAALEVQVHEEQKKAAAARLADEERIRKLNAELEELKRAAQERDQVATAGVTGDAAAPPV